MSLEAIAAAEQAVVDHADDEAWQILTTPIEATIPSAFDSLGLLRTFSDAPMSVEEPASEAEADVLLETADTEDEAEEDTSPLVLELPRPNVCPRLVFGDPAALARLRPRRSTTSSLSAAPPSTSLDQLDLFATLEIGVRSEQRHHVELTLVGAEQLTLL